ASCSVKRAICRTKLGRTCSLGIETPPAPSLRRFSRDGPGGVSLVPTQAKASSPPEGEATKNRYQRRIASPGPIREDRYSFSTCTSRPPPGEFTIMLATVLLSALL